MPALTPAPKPKPIDTLPPAQSTSSSEPPQSKDIVQASHEEKLETSSAAATESVANPTRAHAPDYHWLTGELWFTPGSGWRIHYGSGKDTDKYGGVLTLTDAGPMNEYKIGQVVYIEGQLVDAGTDSSLYKVNRILEVAH